MGKSKEMFAEILQEIENSNINFIEGETSALDTLLYLREFRSDAEKVLDKIKQFETENLEKIDAEAQKFDGRYCGFEVKKVKGREGFNFAKVTEVKDAENKVKDIKKQYEIAFSGFQKGVVQTTEVEGELYWIDENGELREFPEKTYGASYVTVKEIKRK